MTQTRKSRILEKLQMLSAQHETVLDTTAMVMFEFMTTKFTSLTPEAILRLRQILMGSPRELSGAILTALEKTLAVFEGVDSASIVDGWYRSATAASYNRVESAAAYLGAYGPRSILKIQEAVFALLIQKGGLNQSTIVIDYGAGPCLGFAALVDLWSVVGDTIGVCLELDYIGLDKSEAMRVVAVDLCKRVKQMARINCSFQVLDTSHQPPSGECLIVSNVLNAGEGCEESRPVLWLLLQHLRGIKDIVAIEPATEQASRQMCSLADGLTTLRHIGPCPSSGSGCTQWTFRQFTKRSYAFERRCLGKWAPAALIAKYALALLSYEAPVRSLPDETSIIVGQPLSSNRALTCRFGKKQYLPILPGAAPWDAVTLTGNVKGWWP